MALETEDLAEYVLHAERIWLGLNPPRHGYLMVLFFTGEITAC